IRAEFTGELSGAAGESVRSTLAELDSAAVNFIRLSTTGVAWVGRMGIGSGWLVFASVGCGAGLVCPESSAVAGCWRKSLGLRLRPVGCYRTVVAATSHSVIGRYCFVVAATYTQYD